MERNTVFPQNRYYCPKDYQNMDFPTIERWFVRFYTYLTESTNPPPYKAEKWALELTAIHEASIGKGWWFDRVEGIWRAKFCEVLKRAKPLGGRVG